MQAVPIVLAYDFVCPWCWILDAQATAAGLAAGLKLAYEKVARTPNTRRAHRLLQFAMLHGNAENMARLFDAIFAAYFSQGRDIGSVDTLVEIAGEQGFDSRAAYAYLLPDAGNREVNSARL